VLTGICAGSIYPAAAGILDGQDRLPARTRRAFPPSL